MSVRWSESGTFLASGADDKVVLIWALELVATSLPTAANPPD